MAKLPAIPSRPTIEQLAKILAEHLDTYAGRRGDPADAYLTLRQFEDMGGIVRQGGVVSGQPTYVLAPGLQPYIPDPTKPPAPSGLTVTPGMQMFFVEFDSPTYTVGHGPKETRVYAANYTSGPLPVFNDAVYIGAEPTTATVYVDKSAFGITRHYWITNVSVDGEESDPAGGTNGVSATLPNSPDVYLDALTGALTESQLATSLATRIDLIDAPSSTAGSVAARILAEATARGTAISTEQTLREAGDTALAGQISLLTAGVSGSFDPGVMWHFDANVEGWTGNGTVTWGAGWLAITGGAIPWLDSPATSVIGAQYSVIKARIKRIAGSGWTGRCYYTTSGHGLSFSYYKAIAAPSIFGVGDVAVVEFDMSSLTAGGTDWVSSTITGIRLEFGAVSGDNIEVDWVGIGRNAPGASSAALQTEQQARITGDAAESTARQALATKVTGLADPSSATLGTLTAGLLFDERQARSTADAAQASSISTLTARLNSGGDISTAIITAQNTASAKNATFVQGTAPTATRLDDLWVDTANGNLLKRWTGSAWAVADDQRIGATATSVTTLQSQISGVRPNLVRNGGFEHGTQYWDGHIGGWGTADGVWGRVAFVNNPANLLSPSAGAISSQPFNVQGGEWYTVSADTGLFATTGECYVDLVFFNSSGTMVLDGPQNVRSATHDHSSAGRTVSQVEVQAPATAVLARARFVWQSISGLTYIGVRYIKAERGRLPATAYSSEASDALTGGATVSLQQSFTTQASQITGLHAQYTVKIDANGYVSGFGLASTAINAAPTSEFVIRADKFKVASPTGPGITPAVPFTVLTTPTVEGGVSFPAGVYMDAAVIRNLDAMIARFGSAAIDEAKIGQLSVTKLNVSSMTAGFASAVVGQFGSLSAMRATLGDVSTGTITLNQDTAGTWAFIRSSGKWWGDTVNGFISAAHQPTGSYFSEFRAASGSSLILEKKSNGPSVGFSYLTQVIDAAGVERFRIDPAAGVYKLRGRVEADEGYFAGNITSGASISGASGYFGTITSGLMRNPTDTTRFNLNETGSGELLRVNGVTRIWANGKTNWANDVATMNVGINQMLAATNDGVMELGLIDFEWDTGIFYDSIESLSAYESHFDANITGYSYTLYFADWNGALPIFEVTRLQQVPRNPGESFGSMKLRFRIRGRLYGATPVAFQYNAWIRLDSLWLKIFRRT